jgi:hypothetical protein
LKWIKAADKDLRKQKQALNTWIVLMVAAQDSACNQFAKQSTGGTDTLLMRPR